MASRVKRMILFVVAANVGSAMWAWFNLQSRPANAQIQAGFQSILTPDPRVKPLYDEAKSDGVLTERL